MGFKKIKSAKYLELHLKYNPKVIKADLENRIKVALQDYKKGIKCSCGNDIWVF